MITVSVQTDIEKALAKLATIAEAQQFRFSVARALTMTAAEVQQEVRRNMPSRFTIRRQWVVQGIRMERATKDNLTARIFSRDDFMGLQEYGGDKHPRGRMLAVPTRMVRRTPKGLVAKRDKPRALGDKVEEITYKGNQWLALKKPRAGRGGNDMRLMYLLIPRADIDERLGLRKDAERIARLRFPENLQVALADAVARAR
jgi:hypothetical protein